MAHPIDIQTIETKLQKLESQNRMQTKLLREILDRMIGPQPENAPKLYTIQEACNVLNAGRSKIYELLREKNIQTVTVGKRQLIPHNELMRMIEFIQIRRIAA